jgi:hypothetical protein
MGNKKAPDLRQAGLRIEMMRSSDYARTPPEAPEVLPVFVVRFALLIIARELMGRSGQRQWVFAPGAFSVPIESERRL